MRRVWGTRLGGESVGARGGANERRMCGGEGGGMVELGLCTCAEP